jgi:hypothetical protein
MGAVPECLTALVWGLEEEEKITSVNSVATGDSSILEHRGRLSIPVPVCTTVKSIISKRTSVVDCKNDTIENLKDFSHKEYKYNKKTNWIVNIKKQIAVDTCRYPILRFWNIDVAPGQPGHWTMDRSMVDSLCQPIVTFRSLVSLFWRADHVQIELKASCNPLCCSQRQTASLH